MKRKSHTSIEDAIVDLYLNVKILKQEDVTILLNQLEKYDEKAKEQVRQTLRKTNPFTIIEYIKRSIDILVDLKVQEQLQHNEKIKEDSNFTFEDSCSEYEKLLRKLESDIRNYIKVTRI